MFAPDCQDLYQSMVHFRAVSIPSRGRHPSSARALLASILRVRVSCTPASAPPTHEAPSPHIVAMLVATLATCQESSSAGPKLNAEENCAGCLRRRSATT